MNVATALAVFAVVFPAELPDKSMVAALVLGTRFSALPVWLGIAGAFAVHVTIAVTAGRLFSTLPVTVVGTAAAALFLTGAVLLARDTSEPETESGPDAHDGAGFTTAVSTGFGVVFVAEWGDLTQLLTAGLAARYGDPVSVGIGAVAALWAVAGLGVVSGSILLRVVPVRIVRRISAAVLVVLATVTLVETFG